MAILGPRWWARVYYIGKKINETTEKPFLKKLWSLDADSRPFL